jgi:sterol desaturase/sphingolipid hydroxylase (fatty acid hydroxylase superfamily)
MLLSILLATLVEYVAHRFMHFGWLIPARHRKHHGSGRAQGVLREWRDYLLGVSPIIGLAFLHSIEAGLGFAVGGALYTALAAYSHQVQHERPELVFWLPRPIHHLHHAHKLQRHNFGLVFDFWDRLFGTYLPLSWTPVRPGRISLASYFEIRWI